ncbi:MAG: fucose isomerase [Pyrobaculum sp.]
MPVRAVAAPNVDAETRRYYEELYSGLPGDSHVTYIVVLTGGSEPEVLEAAGAYNIILAWPHYNSLPAALEAAAALREVGRYAEVVPLAAPGAEPPLEKIKKILGVYSLLRSPPRLLLVGRPNKWLVASHVQGKPDGWVDEEEVYRESASINALEVAKRLVESAKESSYSAEDLERIAAYAEALRRRAAGYDGLTLGCWCFNFDEVKKRGWTPCISLALLNDMGVVATCEGDVRALYSAVVLRRIADKPSWISNVNVVRGDVVVLTHDGIPPSMAVEHSLVPRLATKAPAALRGVVKPGTPITLLRVSADLKKAVLLAGRTTEAERVEACATQVAVRVERGRPEALLTAGLGNHLAFVLDDVYDEVLTYFKYTGTQIIA